MNRAQKETTSVGDLTADERVERDWLFEQLKSRTLFVSREGGKSWERAELDALREMDEARAVPDGETSRSDRRHAAAVVFPGPMTTRRNERGLLLWIATGIIPKHGFCKSKHSAASKWGRLLRVADLFRCNRTASKHGECCATEA